MFVRRGHYLDHAIKPAKSQPHQGGIASPARSPTPLSRVVASLDRKCLGPNVRD
jgi:hypothetical protein